MFANQSWLHRRTYSNFYLECGIFMNVKCWLHALTYYQTLNFIYWVIKIIIIGYAASILIQLQKDVMELKRITITGLSGMNAYSNSQILALCHSLNGQQTSAARKSRRKKRTTTASLIIRVKNLQSLLIYFQASPRKIIWERSKVPEEVREFIEAIPEKAHQRMKDYIKGRDGLKPATHQPTDPVGQLGKHYYRQSQLQLGKHYYRQKTLV